MQPTLVVGQGMQGFDQAESSLCGVKATQQALAGLSSFPPQLVLVFASDCCPDPRALLGGVKQVMDDAGHPDIPMAGCTSPWPMTHLTPSGVAENAVVVSIFGSDEISAHVGVAKEILDRDHEVALGEALTGAHVDGSAPPPERGLLLGFFPGYRVQPRTWRRPPEYHDHEIFRSLISRLGHRVTVVGGSAADSDKGHFRVRQFAGYQLYQNSLVLVGVRTELAYACSLRHGFALEKEKYALELTGRQQTGNTVRAIDGKDAQAFLSEQQIKHGLQTLFLGIQGHEPDDFRIEVAKLGKASSLRFKMPMSRFDVLSVADVNPRALREGARECFTQAQRDGPVQSPAALFVVSCLRRKIMEEEARTDGEPPLTEVTALEGCRNGLPLVGFYSAGEQCRTWGTAQTSTNCAINVCMIGHDLIPSAQRDRDLGRAIETMGILSEMSLQVQLADRQEDAARYVFEGLAKIGWNEGVMLVEPRAVAPAVQDENMAQPPVEAPQGSAPGSCLVFYAEGPASRKLRSFLTDSPSPVQVEEAVRTRMPQALCIPLSARRDSARPMGRLWLSPVPEKASAYEKGALSVFAAMTATALRRLHESVQLERSLDELAKFWQAPGRTLHQFLNTVVRLAAEITASDISSIRLVDLDRDALYYRAVYPPERWPAETLAETYPLDKSSLGVLVLRTNSPCRENNVRANPDYIPVLEEITRALHVPIPLGGEPIGAITVNRIEGPDYDLADQHRLMRLGQRLGAAIRYTRAAVKAETVLQVVEEFLGTVEGAASVKRMSDILNAVAVHARIALDSQACAIFLVDRNNPRQLVLLGHTTEQVKAHIGATQLVGTGLTGRTALENRAIRLHRVEDQKELTERYGQGPGWKHHIHDVPDEPDDQKPFLAVPICWGPKGKRLLGVIRCLGKKQLEHFSQDDENLLKAISEAVAIGIMHAWSMEDLVSQDAWQSTFIRLATHQLRGPVRNLRAALEFPENEALQKKAHRGIESLDHLITDLLQYMRVQCDLTGVHMRRVDLLQDVVQSELHEEAIVAQAQERRLKILPPPAKPLKSHVMGDAMLLRQCLNNLLINAIRFSPEDGKVYVILRAVRGAHGPDGRVVGETPADDAAHPNAMELRVIDQGPGIAAERQSTLFDEATYLRPKGPAGSSSGFGLPLTRRIARAFGGDITVESRPGDGATLSIWLPLA